MEANYKIVEIEIAQAKAPLPELSNILVDAVDTGASVSFMMPFTLTDAMIYWQSILPAVADGRTILLAGKVRYIFKLCDFIQSRKCEQKYEIQRFSLMWKVLH
ncbi:MAG: hypothetical protein V7K14_01575 [Nostoc sp.]|uniref:hypothetical protein n=1 Tax=Nostoc sp. TaxID=1180 RepID=UPI002FFA6392